jgi:hypothetical protein
MCLDHPEHGEHCHLEHKEELVKVKLPTTSSENKKKSNNIPISSTLIEVVEMAEEVRQGKRRRAIIRTKENINVELNNRQFPIVMVSDFITVNDRAEFHCLNPECDHRCNRLVISMLRGKYGCPKCYKTFSQNGRSKEQINQELRYTNRFIEMTGDYQGMNKKASFKCLAEGCGYEWYAKPGAVVSTGSGCKKCANKNNLNTIEDMNKKLAMRNIILIGNYESADIETTFKCLVVGCGFIWNSTYHSVNYGRGCSRCYGNEELTNEAVDKRLEGRFIIRLEDVINCHTSIRWACTAPGCNFTWVASPHDVTPLSRNGTGCSRCVGLEELTNDVVDLRLIGRNIKRMEDITVNGSTPIWWKCLNNKCNNEWITCPQYVVGGAKTGCPICAVGKSERMVNKLIKEHINYDYLKHHKLLHFRDDKDYKPDFYLEIRDKKIIIEYNGHQHYMTVRWRKSMTQDEADKLFIKQKKRDRKSRKYCKDNDIYLLEIPYYWKEDKIIEELKKINDLFNQ